MTTNDQYTLDRFIWDETHFAQMGWHDVRIRSHCAREENFEYLIDLDYIFKWVELGAGETNFKFWVSPATMRFENVSEVRISLQSSQGTIEVADLRMEDPKLTPNEKLTEYLFRFECQEGEIQLRATGFKMFVRQKPQQLSGQYFTWEERKGISFDCHPAE